MQIKRFRRILLAILLLLVAEIKAQTSTLTPAQTDAIKAQETRENDGLGQFKYDSITFDVVRVQPAKKLVISPEPTPGTIEASVIEHLSGGKQPPSNQGYRDAIYWLVPQPGGGWATGYIPGRGVVGWTDTLGTYSTKAEAAQKFAPPKEITVAEVGAVGGAAVKALPGLILGGAALLVVFVGPIFYIVRSLKKGAVPSKVVCPGCATVNYPQTGLCGNCSKPNTYLSKRQSKKGFWHIVMICRDCKGWTQFDPYCTNCETNLTQQLVHGHGAAFGPR